MRTKDAFVRFLTELPVTATFSGRTQLLDGVAQRASIPRSEENLLEDLQRIVNHVCVERHALKRLVHNTALHLQPHEVVELEKLATAIWTRPVVPAIDLGAPHRFDLHSVMEECLPRIRRHTGLVGFTLQCPCDRLIHTLIERVKDEMSALGTARTRIVNTVGGLKDVPSAVAELTKMRHVLAVQDIICGGVVFDGAAVETLWTAVRAELGPHCSHRLVLFLMTREEASAPAGMHKLPTPVFRPHHAESWWREIVSVQGWTGACLREILAACTAAADDDDGRLDMDGVYQDLKDALDLLKIHSSEEVFREAWIHRHREAF